MPYSWLPKLANCCRRNGILFMSSVFDEASAARVNPYVQAHKIASYELNHLPLIRKVAAYGKPLIMSTGTCEDGEIEDALDAVKAHGDVCVALMQCTASYPAPMEALNLRAIVSMRRRYRVPVGLSDHSRDPLVAPLGAVALGATLIEKHFTLSNKLSGPDHKFAVEPQELKRMVAAIRALERGLGTGEKAPHPAERELVAFAKRGIQAIADIRPGQRFSRSNVAILRPGKQARGLAPKHWDAVLKARSKRPIPAGDGVLKEDLAR